jgi:hypothetical protein
MLAKRGIISWHFKTWMVKQGHKHHRLGMVCMTLFYQHKNGC